MRGPAHVGLVVRFTAAVDDPAALDGKSPNAQAIGNQLIAAHGATAAANVLARLMREAGEIYQRALEQQH